MGKIRENAEDIGSEVRSKGHRRQGRLRQALWDGGFFLQKLQWEETAGRHGQAWVSRQSVWERGGCNNPVKYSSPSLFNRLPDLSFSPHKCVKLLLSFLMVWSSVFPGCVHAREGTQHSLENSQPPAPPRRCYRSLSSNIKQLTAPFLSSSNPWGNDSSNRLVTQFLCFWGTHQVMESIKNLLFHYWIPRDWWPDSSMLAPLKIKKFPINFAECMSSFWWVSFKAARRSTKSNMVVPGISRGWSYYL